MPVYGLSADLRAGPQPLMPGASPSNHGYSAGWRRPSPSVPFSSTGAALQVAQLANRNPSSPFAAGARTDRGQRNADFTMQGEQASQQALLAALGLGGGNTGGGSGGGLGWGLPSGAPPPAMPGREASNAADKFQAAMGRISPAMDRTTLRNNYGAPKLGGLPELPAMPGYKKPAMITTGSRGQTGDPLMDFLAKLTGGR